MENTNIRKKYLYISLTIIGLALLISFLIINHPNAADNQKITNNETKDSQNVIGEAFSLEKTNKKLNADVENLEIADEDNLTMKFSAALANQIIQLNENNDLSSGQLEVPNEELFSDEMINKYKDDFLKDLTIVTITDLNFGEERPPHTSVKYFADILQIIYDRKITDDIIQENLSSFIDNENPEFLKDAILKLNDAITDFKQLTIPPSFADIHLELVNLMTMKKAVMVALYNYQKDPISAIVGSELMEELDNQYQSWMLELSNKLQNDGVQFSNY